MSSTGQETDVRSLEPITEVPSRKEFYVNWVVPRRPMWLRLGDLARLGWRTDRWTPKYLARRAGLHPVKVLKRRNPRGDFQPENTDWVDMPFHAFLKEVMARPEGTDELYLNIQRGVSVEPPLLQLMGDFSVPDFYCEVPIRTVVPWFGRSRRGIITVLHHDFNDNIYVIVSGRKRISLFPPEQAPNLYPRGDLIRVCANGYMEYRNMQSTYMPHLARVDPEAPDLSRFPGFEQAQAERQDFDLEAGDVLFIPTGWFHQVHSMPGEHIALSFFAQAPDEEGLRRMRSQVGGTS